MTEILFVGGPLHGDTMPEPDTGRLSSTWQAVKPREPADFLAINDEGPAISLVTYQLRRVAGLPRFRYAYVTEESPS